MFKYKIYVGVWNETVERDRDDIIDYLAGESTARIISVELKGKPVIGNIFPKSKLP